MANTFTIQSTLVLQDAAGYQLLNKQASIPALAQTGSRYGGAVQVIPTTAAGTALVIPAGVSSAGWAWFRNNDVTNYIDIGVQVAGTFYPFLRLYPGHGHLVSLGTLTPYALANTASVPLEYQIGER